MKKKDIILPLENNNVHEIRNELNSKLNELIDQNNLLTISKTQEKEEIKDNILNQFKHLETGIKDLQIILKILVNHDNENNYIQKQNNKKIKLIDEGFDHIFILDLDFTIIDMNKNSELFLEKSQDKLISKNIKNILSSIGHNININNLREKLNLVEKINNSEIILRQKKKEIHVNEQWILKRDDYGYASYYIYIFNKKENHISTKETSSFELKSNENNDKQIQMKSICHDFRNNIMSIAAGLDLLQSEIKENRTHALLMVLKSSLARGDQFIERLEVENEEKFHFQAVYLPEIIEEIKLNIQTYYPRININVINKNKLPTINADPLKVYEIINNLCLNAVESMKEIGEIIIKLGIINKNNFPILEISITDHGCGIPKHLLNKIFEIHYSTKNQKKRSGIGLAAVKNLLQKHNADIDIDSELNKGSKISIHWPLN